MSLDLAALAADQSRIDDLEADELPGLIGEAEALRARLWARLQAMSAAPVAPAPTSNGKEPDRLLTAQEAADVLGVSKRWIYRKSRVLPFTRRIGRGTLRFSERGLHRWQESRR